jgi:hypothetical protein
MIDASSAERDPEFTIAAFTIVPDHTIDAHASPHGPDCIACSIPNEPNTRCQPKLPLELHHCVQV